MSERQSGSYKFDYTAFAREQIQAIATVAKTAGNLGEFLGILKKAVHRMETDPHGWGDPEYRSKFVDGLYCHGLLRPITFRYVIYEQVRGVVLLSVKLYAEFE